MGTLPKIFRIRSWERGGLEFTSIWGERCISLDASRRVYQLVPMQDFSKPWTDEELYAKYKLTQEEIDFIESMIKPME
jgi:site-specific DNA-methyltransferase (adenine-specific)